MDSMLLSLSGAHSPFFTRNVVVLHDSSGNIGVGEVHGGNAIASLLESYAPLVEGKPIGQVRGIVSGLRRASGGSGADDGEALQKLNLRNLRTVVRAETAVECALLDLLGKHLGLPVAALLGEGQQRDFVEALGYLFFVADKDKTDLPYIDETTSRDSWFALRRRAALTAQAVVEQAHAAQEHYGFRNFKLKCGVLRAEEEIATLKALADAFPEARLSIDPNGAWPLAQAVELCNGVRDLVAYVEDPCGPEQGLSGREIMSEFRRATGLQVATNMIATNWRQFQHALVLNALDIPLADPHFWTMIGSIRVSQLCAEWGMTWGLHSNNHFDITLAMYVQVAAAAPGEITPIDTHWIWQDGQQLSVDPPRIVDGRIGLSDRPGLGIDVDMARLEEAHALHKRAGVDDRDDAVAMQYLIPNWTFDSKMPALVR